MLTTALLWEKETTLVKEEDSLSTPLVRHLVFPYDLRDDRPPKFMLPPFQIQFSVNNWKK